MPLTIHPLFPSPSLLLSTNLGIPKWRRKGFLLGRIQEESGIWILDIMIPREYWARTPNATRHLPQFFAQCLPYRLTHRFYKIKSIWISPLIYSHEIFQPKFSKIVTRKLKFRYCEPMWTKADHFGCQLVVIRFMSEKSRTIDWYLVDTVAQKTVPMFGHFIIFGL